MKPPFHVVRGVPCFNHFQWYQQTIWLMADILDEEALEKEVFILSDPDFCYSGSDLKHEILNPATVKQFRQEERPYLKGHIDMSSQRPGGIMTNENAAEELLRQTIDNPTCDCLGCKAQRMGAAALWENPVLKAKIAELEKRWVDLEAFVVNYPTSAITGGILCEMKRMTNDEAANRLERILRDPNDHWSEIGKESLEMGAAALRENPGLKARIAELEKEVEEAWHGF